MSEFNRIANSHNIYQGASKRVLCVCSAGLLRSPTAAKVLSQVYGYNTRAAGAVKEYALIFADDVLLQWANEVVFMGEEHKEATFAKYPELVNINHQVLDIPDMFEYNDMRLVKLILSKYKTDDKRLD